MAMFKTYRRVYQRVDPAKNPWGKWWVEPHFRPLKNGDVQGLPLIYWRVNMCFDCPFQHMNDTIPQWEHGKNSIWTHLVVANPGLTPFLLAACSLKCLWYIKFIQVTMVACSCPSQKSHRSSEVATRGRKIPLQCSDVSTICYSWKLRLWLHHV